ALQPPCGRSMGLTIYYDWKTKIDLPTARRLIRKFGALAAKLPFDEVSEIYELDPPDRQAVFSLGERSHQGPPGLRTSRSQGNQRPSPDGGPGAQAEERRCVNRRGSQVSTANNTDKTVITRLPT